MRGVPLLRIHIFLLVLLCHAQLGQAIRRPREHSDERVEVQCILNAQKYCHDKPRGHIFKDGCRECQCQGGAVVLCASAGCTHTLRADEDPVKFCGAVMRENEMRLKKGEHKLDSHRFGLNLNDLPLPKPPKGAVIATRKYRNAHEMGRDRLGGRLDEHKPVMGPGGPHLVASSDDRIGMHPPMRQEGPPGPEGIHHPMGMLRPDRMGPEGIHPPMGAHSLEIPGPERIHSPMGPPGPEGPGPERIHSPMGPPGPEGPGPERVHPPLGLQRPAGPGPEGMHPPMELHGPEGPGPEGIPSPIGLPGPEGPGGPLGLHMDGAGPSLFKPEGQHPPGSHGPMMSGVQRNPEGPVGERINGPPHPNLGNPPSVDEHQRPGNSPIIGPPMPSDKHGQSPKDRSETTGRDESGPVGKTDQKSGAKISVDSLFEELKKQINEDKRTQPTKVAKNKGGTLLDRLRKKLENIEEVKKKYLSSGKAKSMKQKKRVQIKKAKPSTPKPKSEEEGINIDELMDALVGRHDMRLHSPMGPHMMPQGHMGDPHMIGPFDQQGHPPIMLHGGHHPFGQGEMAGPEWMGNGIGGPQFGPGMGEGTFGWNGEHGPHGGPHHRGPEMHGGPGEFLGGPPFPGAPPVIGPDGLEAAKQTIVSAENETAVSGTSAKAASNHLNETEPGVTAQNKSEPVEQPSKTVIQRASFDNGQAMFGSPGNGAFNGEYAAMSGYWGSPTADLMKQIRVLENEIRHWRAKYDSCQSYRARMRTALSGEIERAKNAGWSIRQLPLTALPILLLIDLLPRLL